MFVPPLILRDVFNSLAFGTAIIIIITWLPAAIRAMRESAETGEWQLVLAIFLVWLVVACQRVYVIVFNSYGRPQEWAESAISGFWPYSFLCAGLLFLSAPGVDGDRFKSNALWAIVAAVGIGCLTAGILIGSAIPTG